MQQQGSKAYTPQKKRCTIFFWKPLCWPKTTFTTPWKLCTKNLPKPLFYRLKKGWPSFWPYRGQVIDLKMAKMWPSYWPYSIYIYGHIAYNLIRWATFRLQKVKKKRERWKIRQEKAKMRKKDKTFKREKPPHLVWGFFWVIFYYKTGEILRFWPFLGPLIEVMAIYICIHIYIQYIYIYICIVYFAVFVQKQLNVPGFYPDFGGHFLPQKGHPGPKAFLQTPHFLGKTSIWGISEAACLAPGAWFL